MRNKKYYIAIDDYERRIIIDSLNNLRNKLIADGRYTLFEGTSESDLHYVAHKRQVEQLSC